jgi:predicted lipid carrier protein YhbT
VPSSWIARPPGRLPLPPAPVTRLVADFLPPALLQPLCDFAIAAVGRRHRTAFQRLAPYAGRRVAVMPSDLPFAFEIVIDPTAPHVRCCRTTAARGRAEAEIKAPLGVLIDLLEGRIDGDALFFSRELTISGDTELIVAIRNAVDDAEIDLVSAVADALGPFAGPFRLAARTARAMAGGVPETAP